MKDYIDRNLEPDEQVVVRARFHWFFNLKSLGMLNAFTHLLVTDRRVLKKTGILSARTQSIALSQIESKDVEQSTWGRLFGFGDVVIHGSGGKVFRFENLADPTAVSRAVGRAVARMRQDDATGSPGTTSRSTTAPAPPGKPHKRRPVS